MRHLHSGNQSTRPCIQWRVYRHREPTVHQTAQEWSAHHQRHCHPPEGLSDQARPADPTGLCSQDLRASGDQDHPQRPHRGSRAARSARWTPDPSRGPSSFGGLEARPSEEPDRFAQELRRLADRVDAQLGPAPEAFDLLAAQDARVAADPQGDVISRSPPGLAASATAVEVVGSRTPKRHCCVW